MNSHHNSTANHETLRQPELPPEMGFQAYEMFGGNGAYRSEQQAKFVAGDVRNPQLDYPLLDEQELGHLIGKLQPMFDKSREYSDERLGDVLWDSASYRTAEMYMLLQAKRVNELSRHRLS